MALFTTAAVFSVIAYSLFVDLRMLYFGLGFIGVYWIMYILTPSNGKLNTLRRKFTLAIWDQPREPNCYIRMEFDLTEVNKYLKSRPDKVSLTVFALKTLGLAIEQAKETFNGKLIWDKFVPYKTLDVSCLVEIGEGEDLAWITVRDIVNQNLSQVNQLIKDKATNIKKNKGDKSHKQRTSPGNLIPPFLIALLLKIVKFVTSELGISIPFLALEKDSFGCACLTSVGGFGLKDASAPFTNFMNIPILATLGQAHEKAVVRDGKIEIAQVTIVNFLVDHRYSDGGKSRTIVKLFEEAFRHPEICDKSKLD